ncbi:MAG TPA: ferritin-like domain-containing protein [Gemmatimonadaceae bacterium]|nr:ferritin-like domain-containing protein [Gemmatimonadaceae bacterium]
MALDSLNELYLDQLRDLYSAEKQLLSALPTMAKRSSHPGLKSGFQQHEAQTKTHVQRLDQIFQQLGQNPSGQTCVGMQGLIKEGEELLKKQSEPDVLDAALIAAAQRVEHYEIAGYGCVRTFANLLGHPEQADLLQRTLNEEGGMDHKLTQLAEAVINADAMTAA